MREAITPVHLAGSVLERSSHVCAFFHSKEEEYRVLMPFIKDRLQPTGIDVAGAEENGQLEVRRWQEAYLKDDHFDQYRMIETIKDALDPSNKAPLPPDEMLRELKERAAKQG